MASPPIVPQSDADVYVVLDDFGQLGRVYREVEEDQADREAVIRHLREGQFHDPVRIVCFNIAAGSARDVTHEIALEICDRAERAGETVSSSLAHFIEHELGRATPQARPSRS